MAFEVLKRLLDTQVDPAKYTFKIYCDNCKYNGYAQEVKGTERPHRLVCPYCGCNTAHSYATTHSWR